jgi:hypothetical protein
MALDYKLDYIRLSMINVPNMKAKKSIFTGINIAILFALISFSGSVSQASVFSHNPAQTEVRVSGNGRTQKTVSSKRPSQSKFFYAIHWTNFIITRLFQYETVIETHFKSRLKQFVSFKKPDRILSRRYSPRNADELIPNQSEG